MKILITGSTGFIGYNLAKFLNNKKNKIFCNYRKNKKFLKGIKTKKISLLKKIVFKEKLDAIIHCASKTPVNCRNNNIIFYENLKMMDNLITLAKEKKIRKFVFLSSVSVYGKINKKILKENYSPNNPNKYGKSKLICENKLNALIKHNIEFICIRLPIVVGQNSHSNFISTITKKIIQNKTILASNKNSYFNNIVFIDDLSKFIKDFLYQNKKINKTINVGSNYKMKIINVINFLFKKFNKKKKIKWVKSKSKPFLIDLTNAKKNGYQPSTVRIALEKYSDLMLN